MLLCLVPVVLFWSYYLSSGTLFNYEALLAIFQTNMSESKEYLADNATWGAGAILFIAIFMAFWVAYFSKNISFTKNGRQGTYLLVAIVLLDLFGIYKCRHNLVTDVVFDAQKYLAKYADFNKSRESRKQKLQLTGSVQATDTKGVYVLVIGESQNKNHMSAYGYERKTTPWLEAVKEQKETVFFEQAFSCHTHTVPTLTYALTAKNQYNKLDLQAAPSLVEIAEAAGYETAWLSNQVQYSAWDTPITVIASEANQQSWINKHVGESTATNEFDLKLLDSLKQLELKDKMLIIVHLMGNHGFYGQRYPKEFAQFTGRNSVDAYDNSMLYNDYVMQQIYGYAKEMPHFKGLIYFADHSEAVKEGKSHDASEFLPTMTQIPFYMLFSDAYMREHADIVRNLQAQRSKAFTNDLIFNAVLGIMNIKVNDLYEQGNDLASKEYNSEWKRFRTLYSKKNLLEK